MADQISAENLKALAQRAKDWLGQRTFVPDRVPIRAQFQDHYKPEGFTFGDLRQIADALERLASSHGLMPSQHECALSVDSLSRVDTVTRKRLAELLRAEIEQAQRVCDLIGSDEFQPDSIKRILIGERSQGRTDRWLHILADGA